MSSARRAASAALFAALVLAGYWVLAWSSVRAQLAADAQSRFAAWTAGTTPWQWKLGQDGALVWPGSTGLHRVDNGTGLLVGDIVDGNADLSLELRGQPVDLGVIGGARLWIAVQQPVRATLIADGTVIAAADLPAFEGDASLTRVAPSMPAPRADVLRLHFQAAPGTRIALDRLVLVPSQPATMDVCVVAIPCAVQVPRVTAPAFVFPESLLAWRDATLQARPTALIEPRSASGEAWAREIRDSAKGNAIWLLALAPVFVALVSRLRVRPLGRGTAAIELALVFAPWLAMMWAGAPAQDSPGSVTWLLAGTIVGALCLPRLGELRFLGDDPAWRAAARFALAAAAIVGLAAALNALDGDGFHTRRVSLTKLWGYPLWALLQQAVLLHAIGPRTRLACGSDRGGALAAGALFGLLHAPNFGLMAVTFGAGTAFAALGHRHRALLPLAVVHAAAGISLVWAAPPWLLRSAEIGGRYLMAP